MSEFLEKAVNEIPTFAGAKYTHDDLLEYRSCSFKWSDKLNLLFGRDQLLLYGLMAGAKGGIGTTYNFIGPLILKMVESFQAGQLEQANLLSDKVGAFADVLLKYGLLSIGKTYMKELGVNCGDVRLPLTPEPAEKLELFLNEITQLDLDNF